MRQPWTFRFAPILALVFAACAAPGRTAECIAPANAGGGWDLTCRSVAHTLGVLGLVRGTMRVTNVPGAGGAIAYAHVAAERQGDSTVLVAASPATTLRLAQGQFGAFTEEDVRWLGAVAADYGVLAVSPAAPWRSLESLLAAWRADPARVVVGGGSAVGGQDHMKVLVLAHTAGIDPRRIRYVPFDGGGEAVTALLGGFLHVFSGDATEARAQVEAGALRVLAVFAAERIGAPYADVPTAREQGYDVEWLVWRGFYVPHGLDDNAYARWIARIERVAQAPEWEARRSATGLAPYFVAGPAFEAIVREQVRTFRALSRELGLIE